MRIDHLDLTDDQADDVRTALELREAFQSEVLPIIERYRSISVFVVLEGLMELLADNLDRARKANAQTRAPLDDHHASGVSAEVPASNPAAELRRHQLERKRIARVELNREGRRVRGEGLFVR